MKISLLTATIRERSYLVDLLMSLEDEDIYEHIILDLGDQKLEKIVKPYPNVRVIKGTLPSNFAQSYNKLAEEAKGDIIMLLNPDTIVSKGAIKALARGLKDFDIVGSRLMYPAKDPRVADNSPYFGKVQHAGTTWEGKLPTLVSLPYNLGYGEDLKAKHKKTYEVKAVSGAALMTKKSTWDSLGGLDDSFYNCYEEVDFCIRAAEKGLKTGYIGESEIFHYVSGTNGTDGKNRTTAEFREEAQDYLLSKYKIKKKAKIEVLGNSNNDKRMIPLKQIKVDSNDPGYTNRILIGTASMGTVRMEWVLSRYGQAIPMNWSMVQMCEFMNSVVPLKYSVPDAQNIIVQEALKGNYQWLLLIEDDTIPPQDAFLRINKYMRDGSVPVVSGLYFSRSVPSEPLVFRGRGTSVYWDWKFGDKIWCDGVPTGFLLINCSILKLMYEEAAEYNVGNSGIKARKVFEVPSKVWVTPEGHFNTLSGTSDLDWCTRVIEGSYFERAGWPEIQKKKFPFLVDSEIFCKHIDRNTGRQFPDEAELRGYKASV